MLSKSDDRRREGVVTVKGFKFLFGGIMYLRECFQMLSLNHDKALIDG